MRLWWRSSRSLSWQKQLMLLLKLMFSLPVWTTLSQSGRQQAASSCVACWRHHQERLSCAQSLIGGDWREKQPDGHGELSPDWPISPWNQSGRGGVLRRMDTATQTDRQTDGRGDQHANVVRSAGGEIWTQPNKQASTVERIDGWSRHRQKHTVTNTLTSRPKTDLHIRNVRCMCASLFLGI